MFAISNDGRFGQMNEQSGFLDEKNTYTPFDPTFGFGDEISVRLTICTDIDSDTNLITALEFQKNGKSMKIPQKLRSDTCYCLATMYMGCSYPFEFVSEQIYYKPFNYEDCIS